MGAASTTVVCQLNNHRKSETLFYVISGYWVSMSFHAGAFHLFELYLSLSFNNCETIYTHSRSILFS